MRTAGGILLFVFSLGCGAASQVENLRMWPAPDNTRLVFDVSGPTDYTLFTLDNPPRVVIDLRDTRSQQRFPRPSAKDGLLAGIRSAPRRGRDLRVVLDLKKPVKPKSFQLKPNEHYGHRLVVDLYDTVAGAEKRKTTKTVKPGQPRPIVVAIDAGHGGEDPGAKGYRGTYEKNVVMGIARRLEAEIEKQQGMKPVMVRTGDYYIGLRKRMDIAREYKADLFVSIHADAFRQPGVHGASVYVLSKKGASSEAARWLAEKENSADLVGGVRLDDKDDLLASVLLDLSQTASLEASNAVASKVLHGLRRIGKVHKKTVQHAGFAVLKSPDIPSILIETAFISNPDDEKRLRDPKHQQVLASAMRDGILAYFNENPPPGTILAQRRERLAAGEQLSMAEPR